MLAVSSYALQTERLEPGYKNRPPRSKNVPPGSKNVPPAQVGRCLLRIEDNAARARGAGSGKVT